MTDILTVCRVTIIVLAVNVALLQPKRWMMIFPIAIIVIQTKLLIDGRTRGGTKGGRE